MHSCWKCLELHIESSIFHHTKLQIVDRQRNRLYQQICHQVGSCHHGCVRFVIENVELLCQ